MRSRCLPAVLGGLLLVQVLVAVPAAAEMVVTRDLVIPLSDGGELRADLYQPAVGGQPVAPAPTIVIHTPYNKDDPNRGERDDIAAFAEAGFATLYADVRGTGDSLGTFAFLGEREARDGFEAVEWAAAQPWSDGNIGMFGYSYPGIAAAHAAMLQPPHLRAIVPASSYQDAYRDILYPGGLQASEDALAVAAVVLVKSPYVRAGGESTPEDVVVNTADAIAEHPDVFTQIFDHALYDEFWDERAVDPRRITVPTLFWSGWDDLYPRGTLLNWRLAPNPGNALVLGPWGHLAGGAMGDLLVEEAIRWFDLYLRTPPGPERDVARAAIPDVRTFTIDPASEERYLDRWPGVMEEHGQLPSTEPRVLALCAGGPGVTEVTPWPAQGSLTEDCGQEAALPVAGTHADVTGSLSITHDAAPFNEVSDTPDQRGNLGATALLGPVLEEGLVITGPMEARLWATSTADDAQWVARVVDVGPDGTRVVARGWLRAAHRAVDPVPGVLWHPHDADVPLRGAEEPAGGQAAPSGEWSSLGYVPLTPGEPHELRIEVWPTSYRLPAGHRLGLLVQAADTRRVLPGTDPGSSTLLVGPSHPSTLTVPVRVDAEPPAPVPGMTRIGGADRYATAAAVAAARFAPGVRVAYVASGEDFVDALAAGPAAAREGAPVLLTRRDALPDTTAEELARLQPGRIVLLGGTDAVATGVEESLRAYAPVGRRGGTSRFATAATASRAVFADGARTVHLATGADFPDALAGGAAAAAAGGPLLLTQAAALPPETLEELQRLVPSRVVVLGGTSAVTPAVLDELAARGFAVERVAGATRYETAALVADARDPASVDGAWAATGAAFPDALAATAAAATTGDVVLLVEPGAIPEATAAAVRRLDVRRVTVTGGEQAIAAMVLDGLDGLLSA